MGRKLGSKNKKTKIITKTKNTNTNINNVHVHVEKTKTRKRRTTKSKEPNNNPLSNTIGASRPASSNIGFHPRGLINNEPQQPTIINIQPTAQVELLEKKLKKYKDKINENKASQDTINQNLLTTPAPPINVNVNPLQPTEVKPVIKPDKTTPLKKSVVRNIKSKTKAGTLFKPSNLDETGSLASFLHSSRAASIASYEPPVTEEIQQMETRAAKTAAERLDAQHKRQSKDEKRLENRLYALKGTGGKKGAIKLAEDNLMRLNAELTAGPKAAKQKQIEGSITRLTKALENMKIELPNVEAKLTTIRASRTPVKRGRPAGITGFVSSLFSPAK
jgi:hypothetical protein